METLQSSSDASVQVQVAQLDSLMNLAGELVLGRNQLLQAISCEDKRLLEITSQRLDMVTTEIQEQIMQTRMQPISLIFDNFPGIVKNLTQSKDKIVEFSISGEEVELDKTIMEAIEKPLLWIIRKAVDHGIETPAIRKKNGKSKRGKLEIKASQEAGQVVIDIFDDGRGIDADAIVYRAHEKGLITEKQGLESFTDSEKMDLVFLPGMFTQQNETEIFSQFAGIDVIKSDLEKAGGSIDLDGKHRHGLHVRMKLPLTLSIIPSQIIRLGDERFAIPQVNLSELLRIPANQVKHTIETVGGANVIRLRGELLPVIDFAEALGVDRFFIHPEDGRKVPERRRSIADRRSVNHTTIKMDYGGPDRRAEQDRRYHAESALNVAVVSTGKYKYGLVVDAMNDSEEIVVKPLGKHLKDCKGFAGATIMGDGKVALILDVANIGEMCALKSKDNRPETGKRNNDASNQVKGNERSNSFLFFSNAETERFAVPLETVERIEKVDTARIETVGGNRVLKYRGGTLPLLALDDSLLVNPLPESDHYQVICFKVKGRELGVLATPPIDAGEMVLTLDRKTLKQPGVMGSAVIMDQTTLFLDIEQLVLNCKPDFFDEACVNEQYKAR